MKQHELIVTGYAQHGKDTVCEILRDTYGYSFKSSSRFILDEFLYEVFAERYGYTCKEECYADRVNKREEWAREINAYNTPDKARLCKKIFAEYDIYCGLRNREELYAYFEYSEHNNFPVRVAWVDAYSRLKTVEDKSSMTVTAADADCIINNNGTISDLHREIEGFLEYLRYF